MEKREKEYVKNYGGYCPICKSENIVLIAAYVEAPNNSHSLECRDCKAGWMDTFKLVECRIAMKDKPERTFKVEEKDGKHFVSIFDEGVYIGHHEAESKEKAEEFYKMLTSPDDEQKQS